MGLFGSRKQVAVNIPDAPNFDDFLETLQGPSRQAAESISPFALGARESALEDISTPQSITDFFSQIQNTAIEREKAQQTFGDVDRQIRQSLSLSGIASSPALARERSRAQLDINSVLANLSNQRGQFSLQSRLNIDPFGDILNPITDKQISQSNLQKQADFLVQLQRAQESARASNLSRGAATKQAGNIANLIFGQAVGGAFVPGGQDVSQSSFGFQDFFGGQGQSSSLSQQTNPFAPISGSVENVQNQGAFNIEDLFKTVGTAAAVF